MTTRELWNEIMFYGKFDRFPVTHWGGWPETRVRWIKEGLPENVSEHEYFNAVPHFAWIGTNEDLYPPFEHKVIEETDEYSIFSGGDGVIQQQWKTKSCIPHFIDFTFKTAKDWDEYKKRLQPDPGRIPSNIGQIIKDVENSGAAIAIHTGSMMGWIRNWMGVENMSYLMYDSPDVYADMVNTIADLACWSIDQVVPKMKIKPDLGFGWEDICGKSGPLVSPDIFEKYVAQGYKKVRTKLESYGIKLYGIDTDGDIAQLIKHWIDAGVNVQCPVEIGTWNADPMKYRKEFGKELRFVGAFNKLVIEKGPVAIDAEFERRMPLFKDGGCIPMPDHLITPGASLENYKYYLNKLRNLRV